MYAHIHTYIYTYTYIKYTPMCLSNHFPTHSCTHARTKNTLTKTYTHTQTQTHKHTHTYLVVSCATIATRSLFVTRL